ncbi:hypothetical protein [Dyella sp.]|uniref:hypothetical protein n=1 Tax=Dyella sp. TaxID=1869338 RepID=UPI002B4A8C31|nr:hypothetical protein [Dyella sp.]HKT28097.1 hypothetical protein [Dyella sp.]
MPQISGSTLMMAIQAVDAKIHQLAEQLETDDSPQAGELEVLLLSFEMAAQELRTGYEEAQRTVSNLPPYQKLVRS